MSKMTTQLKMSELERWKLMRELADAQVSLLLGALPQQVDGGTIPGAAP